MIVDPAFDKHYGNIFGSEDSLFHFTKRSTAFEHILYNAKLQLNIFKNTDDPSEYSEKLSGIVGWGLFESDLSRASQTIHSIDQIFLRKSGFVSFCVNEYEENEIVKSAVLKSRMWSQYGENQKGVCIVFSKSILLSLFKKHFTSDNFAVVGHNVEYDDRANIEKKVLKVNNSNDYRNPDFIKNFVKTGYRPYLFNKVEDYRDEKEYRIVAIDTSAEHRIEEEQIAIDGSISCVVLGERFHEAYYHSALQLGQKLNIPVYKLIWSTGKYHLFDLKNALS